MILKSKQKKVIIYYFEFFFLRSIEKRPSVVTLDTTKINE